MPHNTPLDFNTLYFGGSTRRKRIVKQDGTDTGDAHLASKVADLLVEAGSVHDRAAALEGRLPALRTDDALWRFNVDDTDDIAAFYGLPRIDQEDPEPAAA